MFLEYFDTLREKPKDVRKRYAFFFTSLITGFIVLVWIGTIIVTNYGSRPPETLATDEEQEEVSVTKLFNSSNAFIEGEIEFTNNDSAWEEEDVWEQEFEVVSGTSTASSTTDSGGTVGTSTTSSTGI